MITLKKIVLFFQCITLLTGSTDCFTILINPAGDAQNAGRAIGDHFERGLTLQFANALQKELTSHDAYTVIINTTPDTRTSLLYNAQVANRLQPDLVLTIHFYHEKATRAHLYIYHFSFGQHCIHAPSHLSLLAYDQAHVLAYPTTTAWAHRLAHSLSAPEYSHQFLVERPRALPCTALNGIMAPAIIIEMGLKQETDWHHFVQPVAHSLGNLYTKQVP